MSGKRHKKKNKPAPKRTENSEQATQRVEAQTFTVVVEEDTGEGHRDNAVQTLPPRLPLRIRLWLWFMKVWKSIIGQAQPARDRTKR